MLDSNQKDNFVEPFDPNALTPKMRISVTLGEFHSTHDKASDARKIVKGDVSKLSEEELRSALRALLAGQRLSDAEDNDHAESVPLYFDEIGLVRKEIKRRKK